MFVDSQSGPGPLVDAWRALGRHIAAAAGAAVALLSLFADTPLHIASLRGAIAWASILALTSAGAWIAARTWTAPELPTDPTTETDTPGASQGKAAPTPEPARQQRAA